MLECEGDGDREAGLKAAGWKRKIMKSRILRINGEREPSDCRGKPVRLKGLGGEWFMLAWALMRFCLHLSESCEVQSTERDGRILDQRK